MPFSFNPGQTTAQGAPGQGISPSGVAPLTPDGTPAANGAPSVPDSPFLFMRYRDQSMSVNAYLQILLIVIAALSILATIVLFSYSMYLSSSIESKKAELATRDATFKDYPIEDMKKLSRRFTILGKIMKEYVSVRTPLKLLEDVVENQAVFNNFNLTKNISDPGYTVGFDVVTTNYRNLVQQLKALNLTQYNKVIPQTKLGNPSDSAGVVRISITAPIFAQGVLPDDVVFVPPVSSTTTNQQSGLQVIPSATGTKP